VSSAEELVPIAWLAGRSVPLDPDELRGAVRRALLLLAAGGDPQQGLELDSRAVTALAAELDTPPRREALLEALRAFEAEAPAAGILLADAELAWLAFACSLLADELAGEE
jgi:hypothetical protein